LESKTQDEALQQLGWSKSTFRRRLEDGRTKLSLRLTRRGITLSAGLWATLLSDQLQALTQPGLSFLSSALAQTTVQASIPFAAGKTAAAGISPHVTLMAERAVRAVVVTKLKWLALLGVATAITTGMGLAAHQALTAKPANAEPKYLLAMADERREEPKPQKTNQPHLDLYGDPLPEGAIARLGTVRFRHGNYITWLAFIPDRKQIISHGYDAIRMWDTATGKEIRRLEAGPDGWIGAAFLTPDGKSLVTLERGGRDNTIRLRNCSDLQVDREFDVGSLQMPRLSPDGKLLAGMVENNSGVEIWDLTQGKRLRTWKAHEGYMWACQFSADCKTLITGGPDKAIRFWNVATGEKKREITGHPNVVSKLALSGDGSLLATVGMTEVKVGNGAWFPSDNFIRIWDVASGKELRQLKMPVKKGFGDYPQGFHFLTFAPDGKTLVTTGQDDLVRFWNPATGEEVRRMSLSSRGATLLSFSADGKTLAIGTNAIRLIDLASGKDVLTLGGHFDNIFAAATTDGQTVVTAGSDGNVVLWDGQSGRERGRLSSHQVPIMSVHLTDGGRRLLTSDMDNVVRLWDLTTGKQLRCFDALPKNLGLLSVSPDGRTVAARGKDNTAILIELETGKEVGQFGKHDTYVAAATLAPDGRTLITCCGDHTVHVWDVKTAQQLRQFEFAEPANDADKPILRGPAGIVRRRDGLGYAHTVSPDGRFIAYGSQEHYLAIQEILTGKTVRLIDKLRPDGAGTLAFSPDGKVLAWSGWRQPAIHLLEMAAGKERQRFDGHKGRVTSLTFSADGHTLISGGEDTTAMVWDLSGKLSQKKNPFDLESAWRDLANDDASRAYQAMCRLAASPTEAIPYLRKNLQAVPDPDKKRLTRLIGDLDSNQFTVRESAEKELEKMGEVALGALRKAMKGHPSAEARRRLEQLINKQDLELVNPSPDHLRAVRAVEVLELAGTPEAQKELKILSQGAPEARLTQEAKASLERLAHRSSVSP
jgi:WD40 repeat protein